MPRKPHYDYERARSVREFFRVYRGEWGMPATPLITKLLNVNINRCCSCVLPLFIRVTGGKVIGRVLSLLSKKINETHFKSCPYNFLNFWLLLVRLMIYKMPFLTLRSEVSR